jgi:hypothetical protein
VEFPRHRRQYNSWTPRADAREDKKEGSGKAMTRSRDPVRLIPIRSYGSWPHHAHAVLVGKILNRVDRHGGGWVRRSSARA